MIPTYPNFAPLKLSHSNEIKNFCKKYDPYSDFNFTSLYSWDIRDDTEVSFLNSNLVVKMPDYLTGEVIYSMMGDSMVDESILELSKLAPILSLVPEVTINHLVNKEKFEISEDRDNFDYIYKIEDIIHLTGKSHKVKRNKYNNFVRTFENNLRLRHVDFRSPSDLKEIERTVLLWSNERGKSDAEIKSELTAINRCLQVGPSLNITGVIAYIENDVAGFSINEVVDETYTICHFQKALYNYEHLDTFITQLTARELLHYGCTLANWEQDLGIPGLRRQKESYKHEKFLKKYHVKSISGTL